MGAKEKPFTELVADSRAWRDGRFIEEIGYYDPMKDPGEISIDAEKKSGSETARSRQTRKKPSKIRNRRIRVVVSSVVQLVEAIAKSLVDNPDAVFD